MPIKFIDTFVHFESFLGIFIVAINIRMIFLNDTVPADF